MQAYGWLVEQLQSFMTSTQDEVSAWLQEYGILLIGSRVGPSAGLGFEEGEISCLCREIAAIFRPNRRSYFCWVSVMAKWEVINFKPIMYNRLHMLKLIEWELDSDIYISRWNLSNPSVNIPIKCLHVAVAWCGSHAISAWRHNLLYLYVSSFFYCYQPMECSVRPPHLQPGRTYLNLIFRGNSMECWNVDSFV